MPAPWAIAARGLNVDEVPADPAAPAPERSQIRPINRGFREVPRHVCVARNQACAARRHAPSGQPERAQRTLVARSAARARRAADSARWTAGNRVRNAGLVGVISTGFRGPAMAGEDGRGRAELSPGEGGTPCGDRWREERDRDRARSPGGRQGRPGAKPGSCPVASPMRRAVMKETRGRSSASLDASAVAGYDSGCLISAVPPGSRLLLSPMASDDADRRKRSSGVRRRCPCGIAMPR